MGIYFYSIVKTNNSLKKGNTMLAYYLNQTVDAVQAAKKNWVNNTVFDTALAGHMIKFVDTQAEYTKAALSNFESFAMGFTGYAVGKAQETAKTATEWAQKLTPKA
jgi:hypothetical protein